MVRRPHRDFEQYRVSIFAREFGGRLKRLDKEYRHPLLLSGASFLGVDNLPVSSRSKLHGLRRIFGAVQDAMDPERMTSFLNPYMDPEAFVEHVTWDFVHSLQRAGFPSLGPAQSFESQLRSFTRGAYVMSFNAQDLSMNLTGQASQFQSAFSELSGDLIGMVFSLLKQEEEEAKVETLQQLEEELQRYVSPSQPQPKPYA